MAYLITDNATKDNEFRKEKFIYNGETDEYTCPAGDRLRFFENKYKNGMKKIEDKNTVHQTEFSNC